MNEKQRLANYTKEYFTKRACPEIQSWHKKIIRTDIAAALCYAMGYTEWKKVNAMRKLSGMDFVSHLGRIRKNASRIPNHVVDIGCGRGEIMAFYHLWKIWCTGIDPSPGALELVPQTMKKWANTRDYDFLNVGTYDGIETCKAFDLHPDTIIFCESLEHIPQSEFDLAWPRIVEMLTETSGLLIVVNWVKNHPLGKDGTGYDHITRVDDARYNRLAKDAKKTVLRKGSHLVLQF